MIIFFIYNELYIFTSKAWKKNAHESLRIIIIIR